MYLKSLTLKGFKSFADPTTLELEPGVTVVVGPNGSGKSNVVDAVAWVLGAQGPRIVRSSKMDDVIFAGTASRAALGRAEVSLVIDNSRHDLPLDFNEVTITRTLFRSGESEYAINGVACRLLDVQELLSDSGVGRSQHVIIGQGQIDAILSARPEERRLVIEEAAGILKFRRRRERALRRLEASETSLTRLQDLLREVRRQMRPLERQAASAHLHAELGEELGLIRRYLAGVELRNLEQTIRDATEHARALETSAASLGEEFARAEERLQVATDSLAREPDEDLTPQLATLDRLHERSRGLLALLEERRRSASAVLAALEAGGDVAALEEGRRRTAEELAETEREAIEVAPQWEQLASAEASLIEAEVAHSERFAGLARSGAPELVERRGAAAEARGVLGTIRQQATVSRTRVADLAVRIGARRDRFDALERRRAELVRELAEAQRRAEQARLALERQVAQRRDGEARLSDAVASRHRAESRAEALELALAEARERADLGRLQSISGLLGTLRELLVADTSVVPALEGALLGALDAAVLTDAVALSVAIDRLTGRGGALLMPPSQRTTGSHAALPPGCRWLRELVDAADPRIGALLDAQLDGVALTELALADALELSAAHPEVVLVTKAGDRVARSGIRLSATAIGATVAALEEAQQRRSAALVEVSVAEEALAELTEAEERAGGLEVEQRVGADVLAAELGAIGRELDEIKREISSLETEAASLTEAAEHHEAAVAPAEAALVQLEGELALLEAEELEAAGRFEEADGQRRLLDERARALAALRRDLEVRAAALEERRELLNRRLVEIDQSLLERRAAVQEAALRRGTHEAEERAMAGLAAELAVLLDELARRASVVGAERDRRRALGRQHLERLGGLRRERDTLQRQLSELHEQRQRNEMTAAEARIRHEAAVEALHRDLDIEPAEAIATPRPQLPQAAEPAARARLLERELRDLGPVNPLAAEELSALTERSEFLESQLEDVRRARRELNQVIHAVDSEIVDVFAAAYEDVAANFEALFSMLFPGGEGRLSLTAPDDLLETGVEIEARPAGRNVRRLSLLSGGERSLVAMAYLFSVFRARPSPFYLMDEVEAALDEVNLVRFHGLVNEFRDEAQLIIVSHQKKTMEIADSLYGISMQPGGGSKVISERVATGRPSRPFALEPMGRPS